jgi:antitoxin component of MazEF toxin-antitoxin module
MVRKYRFILYLEYAYFRMVMKINFNFGKRKVQKVRYTFLIPLPAAWAKNANLYQSSSVNIEMLDDNTLRIIPVPQARQDLNGTESMTPTN